MYATQDDICPIAAYKLFASKRPSGYCQSGCPIYIAHRTRALTGPDCQWSCRWSASINWDTWFKGWLSSAGWTVSA
ncbi:hypothetical protein DPMN_091026 [Dreissena polymorpha]|uniref:Uncharacterized protein n=1 Tax=Dreissena polymorpha TaxID=45954 RepID=A0A9D4KZ60_DREPO|nr:hypothetical protein DPMN_091026 [Dreissena polymorpha]